MCKSFLQQALAATLQADEKICIPYIMAGDGGLDILQDRLQFLKDSGATAVELGIPFSDPVADGPVIQEAGIRALSRGVSLPAILDELTSFSQPHPLPVIFMTYLNPVLAMGVDHFADACCKAGVSGVIIPDLPMEEEAIVNEFLASADIALIRLAALTSPPERLAALANRSDGFLYAVTVNGTTGGRKSHLQEVGPYLKHLKAISSVPVLAGFGISSPEQAKQMAGLGDGVIIGSKIIELLQENRLEDVRELIGSV